MSLDRRLRDGLVTSSTAIDEHFIDPVLDGVVRGARRRQLVRRLVTAGIVLVVGLTAALFGPKAMDLLRDSARPHPAVPSEVPGIITTFAGTGADESFGDGGPAARAGLNYPVDVAVDGNGDVFILDHGGQRVRKVSPSGVITTVVGLPAGGSAPIAAAGEAGSIELTDATGIDVDSDGNLYISPAKATVLKIDPAGAVTTLAGTGELGYSGDGGPATDAKLRHIWDLAVDPSGNVYIAAGTRVRKIDTDGIITTVAGTGESGFSGDGGPAIDARVAGVTGIAADESGNVYVLDYRNNRVRRIDPEGIITTVAGPGRGRSCVGENGGPFTDEDSPATAADLCGPERLSVDRAGNLYVADTYNHRIVMIDTAGVVSTVAGTGTASFSGDGKHATSAELWEPSGVTVAPDGSIYIADSGNHRVRRMSL